MPQTTNHINGITINEIHFAPSSGGSDYGGNSTANDFGDVIELYNTTGSSVDVGLWEHYNAGHIGTFPVNAKILATAIARCDQAPVFSGEPRRVGASFGVPLAAYHDKETLSK